MDIHKPKPFHNWREFLSEIMVVVLGISIALTGELLIEEFHWAERTRTVRDQLLVETSHNMEAALYWLSISPCLDRELQSADLAAWQARRSGTIQQTERFSPPLTGFLSDAWMNARSLQVADRLDPKETERFSQIYFLVTEMTGNITHLHELAGEMEPLSRPLDHVSPAEADGFIAEIGRVKELQSRMELASFLIVRRGDLAHAPVPVAEVQAGVRDDMRFFGSCLSDPAKVLRVARQKDIARVAAFRAMGLAIPDLR
jgi:hypothetical protein